MIVKAFPQNPNPRIIKQVVEHMLDGGIVVLPGDAVYSFACDYRNLKAAKQMALLKDIPLEKAHFSLCCPNLSILSEFSKPISTPLFRKIKQIVPGAFTFILNANNNVPKIFQSKKRTIGIRVIESPIMQEVINELGVPFLATSVKTLSDNENLHMTDPEDIFDTFGDSVELIVDCGILEGTPSTVIDCTQDEMHIIRAGKGIL